MNDNTNQLTSKVKNILEDFFDDEFWRMLRGTWLVISLPFLGVFLSLTIGEFTIDNDTYPKFTWMWLTIGIMWGVILGRKGFGESHDI